MNPARLINNIKKHPDYHQAGMILFHNGVVRSTSRDGRKVSGLTIPVDYAKLEQVVASSKKTPGIIEIIVEINEDRNLSVVAGVKEVWPNLPLREQDKPGSDGREGPVHRSGEV